MFFYFCLWGVTGWAITHLVQVCVVFIDIDTGSPPLTTIQQEAVGIMSAPPLRGLVANMITSATERAGKLVKVISVHLRSGCWNNRGLIWFPQKLRLFFAFVFSQSLNIENQRYSMYKTVKMRRFHDSGASSRNHLQMSEKCYSSLILSLIILQSFIVSPTFVKSIAATFCVHSFTALAFQPSESHCL